MKKNTVVLSVRLAPKLKEKLMSHVDKLRIKINGGQNTCQELLTYLIQQELKTGNGADAIRSFKDCDYE